MSDTLEIVTLLVARAAQEDTAALGELVDDVVASTQNGSVLRLLAALAAAFMEPADIDALAGLAAEQVDLGVLEP